MTSTASHPAPATVGQLRESGWTSVPVKEELRRNAIARIQAGEVLFPVVQGYDDTVLPQLENALLAGHDVIFLGERGQAKTRMIRALTALLDEWMPIIAGSEINDDPYAPVSRYARELVAEHGDDTPIEWVHRSRRYGEKLATPDTSIADLIGEVDPIKVAEGRYLSDELTLHYGLVPRTNRGIFAINELPDLAERIQVGPPQRARGARHPGARLQDQPPARPDPVRVGQPRGLHRTAAGSSPRSRTASARRSAPTTRWRSTPRWRSRWPRSCRSRRRACASRCPTT